MSEIMHRFDTMGTFAEFVVRGEEADVRPVIEAVEAQIQAWAASMTRFDPTSELERLNADGHGRASQALRSVLELAHGAWEITDGRFDVGIGRDITAAGYDRDFDELDVAGSADIVAAARVRAQPADTTSSNADPRAEPSFELDADGVVRVRSGRAIDLGGIAKGWAADMACVQLAAAGPCLVNLGGDIALFTPPGDEGWPVGLHVGDEFPTFLLTHGGIATSGQDRRAWRAEDGSVHHHVIDPRTGASAATDILRLSVVASSCVEAEMWSKALMLGSHDAAHAEAERRGLTTVITGIDGAVTWSGALAGVS